MDKSLDQRALDYHRFPMPGKISVVPTKSMANQDDLAQAYSPGVAAPCLAIAADPSTAALYTSRSNLVAVISNGTAVLGLGNIGPLASKPVMEGKACLFKKFANIDVFDIEVDANDPEKFIEVVAALEPTFGGINLEDIKAPECFLIEEELRKRMKIPVFHDDQHGTAIVVGAAIMNALELVGKPLDQVKVVASGAGAAALACLNHLVNLGVKRENVWVADKDGVVYAGRNVSMDPIKDRYAHVTEARTLAEIIPDADVFLGLSAGGVLKPEMVKTMAANPIIMALANPTPEITPELAREARPDCIISTGRSDYPNQVNNVLCFPFLFRGALDVGATAINEHMKMAATRAIAALAKEDVSDVVASAYGRKDLHFGKDYLIPAPFDPRLITVVAPAVAVAAMESGVATRPIEDIKAYTAMLQSFVYRSGSVMSPLFEVAARAPKRVIFAEGGEDRVLRAAQDAVVRGIARPILVGLPSKILAKIAELGLHLVEGKDFEIVDFEDEALIASLAQEYYDLRWRNGVKFEEAAKVLYRNGTLLASLLLRRGVGDAMLCGTTGSYEGHLRHVKKVIGLRDGTKTLAAMNLLMLPGRSVFITDTYINENPTAEEIAEITLLAAEEVRRFGIEPRAAMVSHSNFGSSESASALKMRKAVALVRELDPTLIVDGEMHGDTALSQKMLQQNFPKSTLEGEANLLIMPNLDAAHITFTVLMAVAGQGITVGPILLGAAKPVHVLASTSTVRRITNMTALASIDAASVPAV